MNLTDKVPYSTRRGALEWLRAHVDSLEALVDSEWGESEGDTIKKLRAQNIIDSLIEEEPR